MSLLLLLTDGKLSAIALSKERFIVKAKYRHRHKLKGRRQRVEGFYVITGTWSFGSLNLSYLYGDSHKLEGDRFLSVRRKRFRCLSEEQDLRSLSNPVTKPEVTRKRRSQLCRANRPTGRSFDAQPDACHSSVQLQSSTP